MPYRRPTKTLLRTTILLLLAAVMLVACGQEAPQTTLNPQTESSRTIYDLSIYLFWLGVGVFIVVEGWLIVSIVKYRHRYDDQLPAQIHGNTKVEIAWTIVPAIIAIFIFVLTFSAIQKIEIKPANTAGTEVKVEIIGHQWWWEFRYPDIKDVNGNPLVTANEMWVPSGSVVDLFVTSADVNHDFWIPGLAGKRDALPTRINKIWFRADDVPDGEPETYWGQCAEYCGTQHAYMKMRVVVASPSDFAQWSAQQGDVAVNTTLPASFSAKGCVGCHAVRGTAAAGITGPNLTHFGSRQTIAAGTLDNTPENLYHWLDEPNVVKRGNLMSVVIKDDTLSPDEITELVTYLESLDPGMSAKNE